MTTRLALLLPSLLLFCLLTEAPGSAPSPTLHVRVTDSGTGEPLPCRLTIVSRDGRPAAIQPVKAPGMAVRPGVLYTGTGGAHFALPRGAYTLYATRGPEYGLAVRSLEAGDRPQALDLKLTREVDPQGYVACDPHVHTLTYSGHGDCTEEERMATLAGEGLAVPVAAEHNRHADYDPAARAAGVRNFFTPVIGNEVTTPVGHFIAFPVRPGAPTPEFRLRDRQALLEGIRATPGVRVVILNHPRDLHSGFRPADPARFHPLSGESLDGQSWDVDGIEVVNSGALQSDWMQPYRDWFALLNRGHRMVGIGASDSHDVTRSIVGQGRTYVAVSENRPDRVDVDQVCDSFRAGKALVSLGLLTEAWVDGRFGSGELATGLRETVKVRVRVRGPRWVSADRVELFANGEKIAGRALPPGARRATKADLTFTLPRPRHDVWLVALASGPGVTAPYWPLNRPYQPTRADWEPRMLGSTGPLRVDGDGDGRYSSPLEYARTVLDAGPLDPTGLTARLERYDAAVAVQAASLCRARGVDLGTAAFRQALEKAAPQVRHGFVAYQNTRVAPREGAGPD